jgi:glycogen debranching enzyme
MKPVRFNLEIATRSDFADLFEVKAGNIVRRGRITTEWSEDKSQLRTTYRNQDFCREVIILTRRNDSRPVYANGRISFEVDLQPGAAWHSCLLYELGNGEVRFEAPQHCIANCNRSETGQRLEDWQKTVLKIRTSNEEFYRLNRQAICDMASLRLPIEGTDHLQFVPAAGVHWFVALFGRDSLIVSLQNALVYPDFARGTLDVLGSWQATERDDYRDAEPGKIMH